jgi:hypothetical protein
MATIAGNPRTSGGIFTATFSAIAVTAAQDFFEIVAGATTAVRIREIRIGQYTDFGDAAAEILPISLVRGHTTTGSGGAAVTPVNLASWSRASTCTVARNNTTIAANGSAVTLISDVMNAAAGWWYYPPEEEMIWLEKSTRFCVRLLGAPADSLTMNGTIIFEEMGQAA